MSMRYVVDWILIVLVAIVFYSGCELHSCRHCFADVGCDWRVAHIVVGGLFVAFSIVHVFAHRNRYKSVYKNGLSPNSGTLLILPVMITASVVTGIARLFTNHGCCRLGEWHFDIGAIMFVIALIHVGKRFIRLRKSLKS